MKKVIFLLFLAHGRAVFSDPGIVPLPKHRLVNKQKNEGSRNKERWNENNTIFSSSELTSLTVTARGEALHQRKTGQYVPGYNLVSFILPL